MPANVLAQIEKDRERRLRKKRELQRPWLEARAKRQKASAGHKPEPVGDGLDSLEWLAKMDPLKASGLDCSVEDQLNEMQHSEDHEGTDLSGDDTSESQVSDDDMVYPYAPKDIVLGRFVVSLSHQLAQRDTHEVSTDEPLLDGPVS